MSDVYVPGPWSGIQNPVLVTQAPSTIHTERSQAFQKGVRERASWIGTCPRAALGAR